ncbi:uncharacterized protein LOC116020307 [Ipomoea triloba]|uniref:uncharacterized protein LOC116020307 n=1 Tax=Ipomoea triloba TaxID=35885 RepID=UPI00125D2812|nr:uncharacterized protein LOC116020307 [Ipomoea triloba]
MYASKSNSNSLLSIKSYNPDHTCAVQNDIKNVNAGFLAKYYQDEFKCADDSWNRIQFQQQVKKKFNCVIKLRKSNPGTTAKMKVDGDFTISGRSRFMRLYICYVACREGFLAGCRPFIGLDGCHLKGCQKGGQLLTTVGVDANNAMFPIGFAIVEGELKETWAWFLELLDQDLNISENPNAWSFGPSSQTSKKLLIHKLWAICRATTVPKYLTKMEELRKLNPKATDWVSAREPHHYCRAFFSSFPNCDILLNNLCESWDSSILQFRDNGIMTMSENIRVYLMVRMQQNRDNMKKHPLKIFPKIMKLVEEAKDKFNDCTAYRRWDLTGIPCSHSIAAIRGKGCIHEEYVNNGYTVESYLRSYEPAILPVTSSELWHKTGLPPQLPPKYKAQPGRPKRKRKMRLAELATYQARNKGKAIEEEADVAVEIEKETELTMGVEEAEPEVELQDVVVETQVPPFVLHEIDMMNPQPSQNVGKHEPQVSYFISSHMEQLPTLDNVIRKGGR